MIRELLDCARMMISEPDDLEGPWSRMAALLARQALESALDQLCATKVPGLENANRATQLACLDQLLESKALVAAASAAWMWLSRACHQHHYELAPTAAELQGWIEQTERLVDSLQH